MASVVNLLAQTSVPHLAGFKLALAGMELTKWPRNNWHRLIKLTPWALVNWTCSYMYYTIRFVLHISFGCVNLSLSHRLYYAFLGDLVKFDQSPNNFIHYISKPNWVNMCIVLIIFFSFICILVLLPFTCMQVSSHWWNCLDINWYHNLMSCHSSLLWDLFGT